MTIEPLWQSFENVYRAASELDSLVAAIEDLLEAGELGSVRIGEWGEDNISDEGDWVLTYYLETVRLWRRRRSLGTLSLGFSLRRNEDLHGSGWEEARTAKLYVGFAPTTDAWSTDDLFIDGSGISPSAQQGTGGLWTDPANPERWFFVVRMIELCSRHDLRREVLNPLRLLLDGKSAEEAFKEARFLLHGISRAELPETG
jgi:hypothetical protein